MLESHYFFTPPNKFFGLTKANVEDTEVSGVVTRGTKYWGWGPFVALQPGTDDVIESIGMGLMAGFRRGEGDQSFNFGIGLVIDPNTRVLGDGIRADQPLPGGETEVRYKEEMQTGVLFLSSFSF